MTGTNEVYNRLKQRLKRAGLKLTNQRESICSIFFSQQGHLRAEEILAQARELDSGISLATVYRTLKLLQDYGFAEAHHFHDGQALFEPVLENDSHHDHLICTKCEKIIEFVDEKIERLQLKIAKQHGFIIKSHKMELYGLCAKCH